MTLLTLLRHVTGRSADDIAVLQSRLDVLEALRESPHRKPDLESVLSVSRSTVNRAIKELETAGFCTRTGEGYVATAYGELLFDRYRSFLEEATAAAAAGPLLRELPANAPMSVGLLRGAAVHEATPPVPHQPVTRVEDLLREADRIRGVSRTISQSTTSRLIRDRVLEDGVPTEFVVGADLAEYMRTDRREQEREMAETGRYRLFEVESVPYGLALLNVDGRSIVVCFVYTDSEDLLGTIINDSAEAVEWVESVYDRYRRDAEEFTDEVRAGCGDH